MKISKNAARTMLALAVAVGLALPAGFGPARAVESSDADRGAGDQPQAATHAPSQAKTTPTPQPKTMPSSHPKATPLHSKTPLSQPKTATRKAQPQLIASASRSGVRFGRRKVLTGTASFYGKKFHGKRTYTGERYNMYAMTLACRRLPMGTRVRVTNLKTGKSAVGRVNDYGPNGRFKNRVADLSVGMARKIGFKPSQGLTKVRIEVIGK